MKTTDIRELNPVRPITLSGKPSPVSSGGVAPLKNSPVKPTYRFTSDSTPSLRGVSDTPYTPPPPPPPPEPTFTNTSSVDFESPAYGFAQVSDEHSNYDSFLISGWYKVNAFTAHHGILQIDSSTTVNSVHHHTWIRTNSKTAVEFQLGNVSTAGTSQRNVSYKSVNLDTLGWNHMAQIWTGTKVRIYFNGAFNAQKTNSYTDEWSSGTTAQMIFRLAYGRSGQTDVTVDEFSFSEPGAGLTDAEYDTMVSDIYNGGTPTDLGVGGLNINPVHWWRMGDIDPTLFTGQDWVSSIPNQGSDSTALNINTDIGHPSDATVSSDVP